MELLHDWHSSKDVTPTIVMRWIKHVASSDNENCKQFFFVEKSEGKVPNRRQPEGMTT